MSKYRSKMTYEEFAAKMGATYEDHVFEEPERDVMGRLTGEVKRVTRKTILKDGKPMGYTANFEPGEVNANGEQVGYFMPTSGWKNDHDPRGDSKPKKKGKKKSKKAARKK